MSPASQSNSKVRELHRVTLFHRIFVRGVFGRENRLVLVKPDNEGEHDGHTDAKSPMDVSRNNRDAEFIRRRSTVSIEAFGTPFIPCCPNFYRDLIFRSFSSRVSFRSVTETNATVWFSV